MYRSLAIAQKIVLPGPLVAYTPLSTSFTRGLAKEVDQADAEGRSYTRLDLADCSRLGIAEILKSGATCSLVHIHSAEKELCVDIRGSEENA